MHREIETGATWHITGASFPRRNNHFGMLIIFCLSNEVLGGGPPHGRGAAAGHGGTPRNPEVTERMGNGETLRNPEVTGKMGHGETHRNPEVTERMRHGGTHRNPEVMDNVGHGETH